MVLARHPASVKRAPTPHSTKACRTSSIYSIFDKQHKQHTQAHTLQQGTRGRIAFPPHLRSTLSLSLPLPSAPVALLHPSIKRHVIATYPNPRSKKTPRNLWVSCGRKTTPSSVSTLSRICPPYADPHQRGFSDHAQDCSFIHSAIMLLLNARNLTRQNFNFNFGIGRAEQWTII